MNIQTTKLCLPAPKQPLLHITKWYAKPAKHLIHLYELTLLGKDVHNG